MFLFQFFLVVLLSFRYRYLSYYLLLSVGLVIIIIGLVIIIIIGLVIVIIIGLVIIIIVIIMLINIKKNEKNISLTYH